MIRTLTAALLAATLIATTPACSQSSRAFRPGLINHPVFFKLKNPADAPALIDQCDEELASIPGITSYYCGTPLETNRPSVDLDFHVGLFVAFDSEQDYRNYVAHPLHQKLANEWRDRLEWLRVHDVIDPTP